MVDDNGDWEYRVVDGMFGPSLSEVADVNRLLPMPNDKLHTFVDHFPNLEELTLVKHDHPMTIERIRSHLMKLHTLRLDNNLKLWPLGYFDVFSRTGVTCLTPIVCEKLANCVLHLPSLKELTIGPTYWNIIGEDPKKVLEPLGWALGSKPNVELVMDNISRDDRWFWSRGSGQWRHPRRPDHPRQGYTIPQDQWNVMTKENGPIPFDVMVNRIKQHYGLVVQDDDDDGGVRGGNEGSLKPWVEALIHLQQFDRFDWFHAIFEQMPKVWSRYSTTIISSSQGNDSTTKRNIDSTSVKVATIRRLHGRPINQAVMTINQAAMTTVDDLVGYRKFPFKLNETTLRLVFGLDSNTLNLGQGVSYLELVRLRGELEQQAPHMTLGQEVSFLELARLRGELEQQVRELTLGQKDSYDLYYYVAMLGFSFPEAGQEQAATTSEAPHIDETPVQECLVLQELMQVADEQRVRRLLKELVSQKIDAIPLRCKQLEEELEQEAEAQCLSGRVGVFKQELVQVSQACHARRQRQQEDLEQEMGAMQARVLLFKKELVLKVKAHCLRRLQQELVQKAEEQRARRHRQQEAQARVRLFKHDLIQKAAELQARRSPLVRRQRQQEALEQEMGASQARALCFNQELIQKAAELRAHRSPRRFLQELVQVLVGRQRQQEALEQEMGAIQASVLRFKQELVLKAQAHHSLRFHRDESVRRFKQELVFKAQAFHSLRRRRDESVRRFKQELVLKAQVLGGLFLFVGLLRLFL